MSVSHFISSGKELTAFHNQFGRERQKHLHQSLLEDGLIRLSQIVLDEAHAKVEDFSWNMSEAVYAICEWISFFPKERAELYFFLRKLTLADLSTLSRDMETGRNSFKNEPIRALSPHKKIAILRMIRFEQNFSKRDEEGVKRISLLSGKTTSEGVKKEVRKKASLLKGKEVLYPMHIPGGWTIPEREYIFDPNIFNGLKQTVRRRIWGTILTTPSSKE